MPTEKFMNLGDYKKQAILDAMRAEFMTTPYSEIRISSLIKRAGISRASFYLYFQSKEDLDTALSNASAQSTDARNTLKSTDDSLKSINEQIHYTGQYLANKSIYFDYRKSRNKEKFYEDHRAELTLYESSLRILKEKAQGKKLPTLNMLREEMRLLT